MPVVVTLAVGVGFCGWFSSRTLRYHNDVTYDLKLFFFLFFYFYFYFYFINFFFLNLFKSQYFLNLKLFSTFFTFIFDFMMISSMFLLQSDCLNFNVNPIFCLFLNFFLFTRYFLATLIYLFLYWKSIIFEWNHFKYIEINIAHFFK